MDEALKQRLVGASVLVVLAVIFLPLLFDGSGMAKSTAPMSLDLPEASAENTVTITLKPSKVAEPERKTEPQPQPQPQPKSSTVATKTTAKTKTAETQPQSKKPADKVPSKPKVTTPTQEVAAPTQVSKISQSPSASPSKQQWIVQLGSFGQRSNAQALRDKLINQGFKSFVEASGQGSKQVFRVRVGPVPSRDKAEAIRNKLKSNKQRSGLVMAYP